MPGKASRHYLLFTGERGSPGLRRIAAAEGATIDGPWQEFGEPLAEAGAEAPFAIPAVGGYLVYYVHDGTPLHYEAALSADLQLWSDATSNISLPAGLRHGSILHLETSEYNVLRDYHCGVSTRTLQTQTSGSPAQNLARAPEQRAEMMQWWADNGKAMKVPIGSCRCANRCAGRFKTTVGESFAASINFR